MTPQCKAILRHLKRFNTITSLYAHRIGITSLHRRLTELRNAGYPTKGEWVWVKSRWGKVHVKRYSLS